MAPIGSVAGRGELGPHDATLVLETYGRDAPSIAELQKAIAVTARAASKWWKSRHRE